MPHPEGLTYTLGRMTSSPRHGWAVGGAMAALFLVGGSAAYWAEARGNPQFAGVDQSPSALRSGGNVEETRVSGPQKQSRFPSRDGWY